MNFLKAAIILIIAVTAAVIALKPEMPKTIRAENADFKLEIITEEAPAPVQNTLKNHVASVKEHANNTETVIVQPKQKPKIITETVVTVQEPKKVQTPKKVKQEVVKKQEPKADTNTTVTKEPEKAPPQKKLTPEEEEIIAWNEWRSNLQNQVMRDVVLAAPIGTRFEFSFTVDKFGRISNLKVWSRNSQYTDMAVRKIKPVLLSYQGQSILKFPEKSKRVITNVEGGFTIARTSRYSTPSDYSDYERIK